MRHILSLFLSPLGRIGRKTFIMGFIAWALFYVGQTFWFRHSGINSLNFYLSLLFLILNIQIMFSLYGKRLHDIGRSTWALIGMLVLVLIIAIFAMLAFGGLEYFDTIMQNPAKQADPEFMKAVHQTYQDRLSQNMPKIGPILLALPVLFTVWMMVAKPHTQDNRYGNK